MTGDRSRAAAYLLGALFLLLGGAIHSWLAFEGFATEDLQTLFFLNGAVSGGVAAAVALVRRPVTALVGAGVAGASLVAFGASRVGSGVAGFRATGLEPAPEALLTLIVEVAAVAALALVVVADRRQLVDTIRAVIPGRR